jgi:hypothetical protein
VSWLLSLHEAVVQMACDAAKFNGKLAMKSPTESITTTTHVTRMRTSQLPCRRVPLSSRCSSPIVVDIEKDGWFIGDVLRPHKAK